MYVVRLQTEDRYMMACYVCSPRRIAPDRTFPDQESIPDHSASQASRYKLVCPSRELDRNSDLCRFPLLRDLRTAMGGTSSKLRILPCRDMVSIRSNDTYKMNTLNWLDNTKVIPILFNKKFFNNKKITICIPYHM